MTPESAPPVLNMSLPAAAGLVYEPKDAYAGAPHSSCGVVPGARGALLEAWSYRVLKRAFDVLLASLLLPLLFPLLLALAAAVRLSSKGPVLYRHRRIGQHGHTFYLYKFRTMLPQSEALLTNHLAARPEARLEWERFFKLQADPRVTRIGAELRRTSLDELPQIFNVLAGDMSFVGPRPIVREEIARYGKAMAIYTAARPGITGLWQTSGRARLSYDQRVALDVRYVTTWSFLADLRLLVKTGPALWRCEGAC
jgi:lipopolysaccharide/colanic/teichoic acid biosynthesis glycosyltransferase